MTRAGTRTRTLTTTMTMWTCKRTLLPFRSLSHSGPNLSSYSLSFFFFYSDQPNDAAHQVSPWVKNWKEPISTWKWSNLNHLCSVIVPKDETPPPLPPKVDIATIHTFTHWRDPAMCSCRAGFCFQCAHLELNPFHVCSPRRERAQRRAWPARTTAAGSTAASTSPPLWSGRPVGRTSGPNHNPGAHGTQVRSSGGLI